MKNTPILPPLPMPRISSMSSEHQGHLPTSGLCVLSLNVVREDPEGCRVTGNGSHRSAC